MSQMPLYSSTADMGNRTRKRLPWRCTFGMVAWLRMGSMASCPPWQTARTMGRVFDFAKRRIAGYIVFWILVLLVLGLFYGNDRPAQAGALFVLGFAFIGSLLYTRRLKRKQRARREAREAAQRMQIGRASCRERG